MEYKFLVCRSKEKKWFLISDLDGEKSKTELSSGFDSVCEILGKGDDTFYIIFSTEKLPGSHTLYLIDTLNENTKDIGGLYVFPMYIGMDYTLKVWTKDIFSKMFGEYPENVYIIRHF